MSTTDTPPRGDNYGALCEGTQVTVCCGAYATFSQDDGVLCCKACWNEVGFGVTNDEFDYAGANITASRLLNAHHDLVPVSGFGDEIADNCAVCPFAAGWLQVPGESGPGHATTASTTEVRIWIEAHS